MERLGPGIILGELNPGALEAPGDSSGSGATLSFGVLAADDARPSKDGGAVAPHAVADVLDLL